MKRSLVITIALIALACTDGFPPEFPMPEFTLKSPVTGNEVRSEDINGRPAIIYWFASW